MPDRARAPTLVKVKARTSADLVPSEENWQRLMTWGTNETVTVRVVEPLPAKVSADVAVDDDPGGAVSATMSGCPVDWSGSQRRIVERMSPCHVDRTCWCA